MRHSASLHTAAQFAGLSYGLSTSLSSISFLKPRFQRALRPIVGALAQAGVTANQVTILALLGSVAVASVLALRGNGWPALFFLLPAWLLVRMGLSTVDGVLAHEFGQKSKLGSALNEGGDIVSDAALYAPFALVAPFSPIWVAVVVALVVTSEIVGMVGPLLGVTRRCDGPFGKSDRAIAFGLISIWFAVAGMLPPSMRHLMPAFAVLLLVTIANRLSLAVAEATIRPA